MVNGGEIAEDTLLEPERLGARAIDWDLRCRGLSSGRAVKALQLRRRIHGRSRSSASFNRKTLAPREPSIHGSRRGPNAITAGAASKYEEDQKTIRGIVFPTIGCIV